MAMLVRTALIAGALALGACAQQQPAQVQKTPKTACIDRATRIVAANVTAISLHRYGAASRAAEHAASISLSCGDRWRAANALVVAAELAHQADDAPRAERLLAHGYSIMHALRPPRHATALTSTLMAERLDTARRDMHGQWAYW
jgi:spore coat protein U-like protein